jgi:hypothetical protein
LPSRPDGTELALEGKWELRVRRKQNQPPGDERLIEDVCLSAIQTIDTSTYPLLHSTVVGASLAGTSRLAAGETVRQV